MSDDARNELDAMHDAVSDVRCPHCGAGPGDLCVNPISGRPPKVPHLVRVQAVDQVGSF